MKHEVPMQLVVMEEFYLDIAEAARRVTRIWRGGIDLAFMNMGILLAFMLTVVTMLNVSAFAEDILIQDVTATATSSWVDPETGPSNIVNNLGMSDASSPHTGAYSADSDKPTHCNVWHNPDAWTGGNWASEEGFGPQTVIFTFPSVQDITEFAVWNQNVNDEILPAGYGVSNLTIWTSVTVDQDDWVQRGATWTFDQATGLEDYAGQGFILSDLGGNWTGVRRVKFEIINNWGGSKVGLSEVRFYGPEAANTPPTLTAFAAAVDTTTANSEVELTFAELTAQGDEADTDGTVVAFVVQAVSSGTLKIGITAGSATAYGEGNNTIDSTHKAYWKPALDVTGNSLAAFTVKAKDNGGALSATAVQVTVNVTVPPTGVLIQGVTATASSSFAATPSPAAIVNNSSMSDASAVHNRVYSGDPDKPTHGSDSWTNEWSSSDGEGLVGQWVVFTFPAAQDIVEFAVWNSTMEINMGVSNLTIWTSVSASGDTDWVQRGATWTFAEAIGSDPSGPADSPVAGQVFTLAGLGGNWTGVQRVKFVISSSYGSNIAGLSEVRFYGSEVSSVTGTMIIIE